MCIHCDFQVYNSVIFNEFTEFCNYHHCLFSEDVHHPPKEAQYLLAVIPYSLPLQPLAAANATSVWSGHLLLVESYNMWPFVTGFFHLACFQGSFIL